MKKAFAALAMLGLMLSLSGTLRAESLDGTQWKVAKHGLHKIVFWKTYSLSFAAGQVSKGKGKPTAYTSAQDNGKTTWKAEKTGGKGEQIVMTGMVDGDSMTGTVAKTGKDGKTERQRPIHGRRPRSRLRNSRPDSSIAIYRGCLGPTMD
jgi:hypothetical protein